MNLNVNVSNMQIFNQPGFHHPDHGQLGMPSHGPPGGMMHHQPNPYAMPGHQYLPHHMQMLQCPELDGRAPGGQSSVFFGNISYDCEIEDLNRVMKTCGPFRDMKMMYGDDNKPKGYGFCTFNDPDTAWSAIRNLNKITINNRDLKVHFASDKQSGTNLRPEEVRERDHGEIVSLTGSVSHTQVPQGELLTPETSTVEEMLRSLSDTQKEMLVFSIQDAFNLV